MATYPAFDSQPMSALNAERILLAEELLEAAERAQNFTSASGAVIALRRGDEIIVRTSSGVAPEVGTSFGPDDNVLGVCVRTGKPRECSSDAADAVRHPVLSPLGIRSAAAVPISCDGTVQAVLAVFSQMPAAFSRTHVAILMTLRDVIGSKLKRAAVPAEGWAQAPVPNPTPTAPASAPEEPVAKPALVAAVAPPPPTSNATELLRLVETPPPPPIEPAPGLLGPGEDPGKFQPQPVMAAPSRPIATRVRPMVVAPAPKPVVAVETPSSVLRSYGEAAQSRKGQTLKVLGGVGGLVVLAAALGMYWGTRDGAKLSPPPPAAVAEVQPAALNPEPVTMTVEAPMPKAAAPAKSAESLRPATAEKSAAPAKPAESPRPASAEKSAAPEKPAAEKQKSAPSPMLLAPASPKPKVEAEPAVEAPALTTTATNAGLPELLTPKAPAAALALRNSVVVPATLLESRPPVYPEMARRMGQQGTVKLQVSIAPDGRVTAVHAISGEPMLQQASINAVRQWRYRPATLDGRPVESTAEVSLMFKAPR